MTLEAEKLGERPDWWAVFAGGCTRDQGGLPYHISTDAEILSMVKQDLKTFLQNLPPPALITVARSTDDGYCPPDQVSSLNFFNRLREAEQGISMCVNNMLICSLVAW